MNQRQLECMVRTAQHGRSTKAAGELFTTQPTVAYQITTLERELGVRLFDRDPSGMHLTSEGERLLPALRQALSSMEDALDLARHIRNEARTTVTVMHFQHIHDPLFDTAVRAFRDMNPAVSVRYTMPLIGNALESQDVDVEIVGKFHEGRWPEGMKHRLLFSTRLQAIVSQDSPLACMDSVKFDDLRGSTLVFLSKPVMEALDAWYIDRGEELCAKGVLSIEYADERTLQSIQYHLIGDPLLVFPTQGIHTNLAGGLVMLPFAEDMPLEQHICWRDDGPNAQSTREFVRFLLDHYKTRADEFDPPRHRSD